MTPRNAVIVTKSASSASLSGPIFLRANSRTEEIRDDDQSGDVGQIQHQRIA